MKRILVGALVAYALSTTLFAARWWAQASSFRNLLEVAHQRASEAGRSTDSLKSVHSFYLDYGVELSTWRNVAVRFGDLGEYVVAAMVGVICAICLGASIPTKGSGTEALRDATRWVGRTAVASLLLGLATTAVVWLYGRTPALHPHHLLVVGSFAAFLACTAAVVVVGMKRIARGPGRVRAIGWLLVGLVPVVFWAYIGAYGASQWGVRSVPNNLPMRLCAAAGAAVMRLEASFEYPHRLETDRLVMLYGEIENPQQDADAMGRHLAAMEATLGRPTGSKVLWVRGRLPVLGLQGLCVYGIALGSGESPKDWSIDGRLDRHELAHAALDALRTPDTDAPCFLHEGWAEFQSGRTRRELADAALANRDREPSIGIVSLIGPEWYHRDSGAVYPLGGAFVEFLLRTQGVDAFRRIYAEGREDNFQEAFRSIYGIELDDMEDRFWDDARSAPD